MKQKGATFRIWIMSPYFKELIQCQLLKDMWHATKLMKANAAAQVSMAMRDFLSEQSNDHSRGGDACMSWSFVFEV